MSNDKDFNPDDLPQKDAFIKKEVYQHPQTADTGPALDKDREDEPGNGDDELVRKNRTSKEEGLNEASSAGDGGAFEGLENHGDV